ncbi:hypothetical protein WAI453_007047 [Rhynchosporium graminicola]
MHGLKTLFINHFGAPSLAKNRMKAVGSRLGVSGRQCHQALDHDSLYCSHLMLTGTLQCDSHKFHTRTRSSGRCTRL